MAHEGVLFMLPHRTAAMNTALLEFSMSQAGRDMIDAAVHGVLQSHIQRVGQDLARIERCIEYAVVGARVLERLTGLKYQAVCGGGVIDCGQGHYLVLYPERQLRRKARSLADINEFHCWIEARHALADWAGRLEVVDFTCRHDRVVAGMCGVPYERHDAQDYLWAWNDELAPLPVPLRQRLPPAAQGWLWRDERCSVLLQQYALLHCATFDLLSEEVLAVLRASMAAAAPIASTGAAWAPQNFSSARR